MLCNTRKEHVKENGQNKHTVVYTLTPTKTHLLQFVGLGLVLIAVCILAVSHAKPPHGQDAVDIVSHPGILFLGTSRQKSCHRVLKII